MIISLATNKDINSLLFIWKTCFTGDTIYLNMFFKECFPLTRTYVFKDNDVIVSSISIVPINNIGTHNTKGAYLYGVCTLPQYRGNHLSIKLMEYAEEDCRERGYSFILTRPGSPSLFALYRKNGYTMPIFRQYTTLPLPIYAEGVSFSELTAQRLKVLRNKYLENYYFEWDIQMLDFILSFYRYMKGSAVELESDRYIIGYPDEDNAELFHIQEIGCYNPTIKYPTLYLAGNLIKARHLERTKVRLSLPLFKHYSDLDSLEKEVYVLLKPLSTEIDSQSFFNFPME